MDPISAIALFAGGVSGMNKSDRIQREEQYLNELKAEIRALRPQEPSRYVLPPPPEPVQPSIPTPTAPIESTPGEHIATAVVAIWCIGFWIWMATVTH